MGRLAQPSRGYLSRVRLTRRNLSTGNRPQAGLTVVLSSICSAGTGRGCHRVRLSAQSRGRHEGKKGALSSQTRTRNTKVASSGLEHPKMRILMAAPRPSEAGRSYGASSEVRGELSVPTAGKKISGMSLGLISAGRSEEIEAHPANAIQPGNTIEPPPARTRA